MAYTFFVLISVFFMFKNRSSTSTLSLPPTLITSKDVSVCVKMVGTSKIHIYIHD